MHDSILLLSGGLDSTSVLFREVAAGGNPLCLIFDYGQTLKREVQVAVANARTAGCRYIVAEVPMGWTAPQCALFSGKIPEGRTVAEIAEGGTPATYVPFRNGIMLAYAAALGESRGVHRLLCGGNGLASGNYWDDTVEFARAMQAAIAAGTAPGQPWVVQFPNAGMTKGQVVRAGVAAGMKVESTWSCYHNGGTHCGRCDSCVQRMAALEEASR